MEGKFQELQGDPSFLAALREIVQRITRVAAPEQIILFGSAARGIPSPERDIDLLIIKRDAKRRELAGRIYQALIGVGWPVDIVVATPEDVERYRRSPATVIAPALKEGKLIYAV